MWAMARIALQIPSPWCWVPEHHPPQSLSLQPPHAFGMQIVNLPKDPFFSTPTAGILFNTSMRQCTRYVNVLEVSASPAQGLDEKFFRNTYDYVEDCVNQGIKPNFAQIVLFLDAAESSIALPGPSLLIRWLSWGLGVVVGK